MAKCVPGTSKRRRQCDKSEGGPAVIQQGRTCALQANRILVRGAKYGHYYYQGTVPRR